MTDRQLRDEVVTLVLAGHETTALVLFYAFYLLSQSPESEARLADELHAVVPDRFHGRRCAESEVRGMGGARGDATVSPSWGIAREALADCEIGGYHVPKGTQVFMTQWLVHRDARWFDDPKTSGLSDGTTT